MGGWGGDCDDAVEGGVMMPAAPVTHAPPCPPALLPPAPQGCTSVLYFEARKHKDLYLWVAKSPAGPSVKFHVTNGEGARAELRGWAGETARSTCLPECLLHSDVVVPHPLSAYLCAVHTLDELKLSGNHLRGSRPVLSFDK